jgi:hypothetical protein
MLELGRLFEERWSLGRMVSMMYTHFIAVLFTSGWAPRCSKLTAVMLDADETDSWHQVIEGLAIVTEQRLRAFHTVNKRLPNRILHYRDVVEFDLQ